MTYTRMVTRILHKQDGKAPVSIIQLLNTEIEGRLVVKSVRFIPATRHHRRGNPRGCPIFAKAGIHEPPPEHRDALRFWRPQ